MILHPSSVGETGRLPVAKGKVLLVLPAVKKCDRTPEVRGGEVLKGGFLGLEKRRGSIRGNKKGWR